MATLSKPPVTLALNIQHDGLLNTLANLLTYSTNEYMATRYDLMEIPASLILDTRDSWKYWYLFALQPGLVLR